ncbi:alpha/beta hydrolase family protein [Zavarzinella formosa]|uniref:alpha/beta hydrolase family protein n=1 Tax=Zavarzinella formosa TaxID=360055 RepID=UPI0002EB8415|nr:alpha/beta hydrolase [Zavarzinella formosa]
MTERPGEPPVSEQVRRTAEAFLTPRPTPETPRDREFLQEGSPLSLVCGLAATSWGSGPTVLLAHGWESRRTHWIAFVTALVKAGFRAVAIDAPAHGDSPGVQVNVLMYGKGIADAGREIGPLAGIIGHSFGAAAAIVAMHNGLEVRRAALISGPSCLVALAKRFGAARQLTEEETTAFIELVEQMVGIRIDSIDLPGMARQSAAPSLIVHDQTDEDIPLEEGLSEWPGSRRLVTERYGHRRILMAREVVREIISFIKEEA